jgi:hypothetical protein
MKNLFTLSATLLAFSLMSFTASYQKPVTQTGKTEFTITKDARFSAEEERLFGAMDEKYYNLNSYTASVTSIEFGDGDGEDKAIWVWRNKKKDEDKFTEKTIAGNGLIQDPGLTELYAVLKRHAQ